MIAHEGRPREGGARRGDGCGDRRRGVAVGRRCRLLQRDRGVPEIFDLRRAQEWTAALTPLVRSQPDWSRSPATACCHRAEILQLHGSWTDAMEERSVRRPAGASAPGRRLAPAYYQRGELHRLRGAFARAEEAYRRQPLGREPQPDSPCCDWRRASSTRRRRRSGGGGRGARPPDAVTTAARVRRDHAAPRGDAAAARAAADELSQLADELGAPLLRALAVHARGAVLLAEGDAAGALAALRRAWTAWQESKPRTKPRGAES